MPDLISPGDPQRLAADLAQAFSDRHDAPPDVVACAPGRVNLIGEHVDYNAGRCLPTALPHATYAALRRRDDRRLVATSLSLDATEEVDLDELRPGAVSGWVAYVAGVAWALAEAGWDVPGLEVVVDSRVPVGAGLSSSAALECAVGVGVQHLLGLPDAEEVRRTLVAAGIRAESEMAGAATGGLDQSAAVLAQQGHALLLDFADHSAAQVPWDPDAEGLTLLVVDTRVSHSLTDGGYGSRRADCEAAARRLGVSSLRELQGRAERLDELDGADGDRLRRRSRHVLTEMDRVDAFVARLEAGELTAVGPLLDASHASLRDDFEVSCPELDLVVEVAREHGALGARMTGGGFGGSAVALVPADRGDEVAGAVRAAFEHRAWTEPGLLLAPASAGARRLR